MQPLTFLVQESTIPKMTSPIRANTSFLKMYQQASELSWMVADFLLQTLRLGDHSVFINFM